MSRSIDERIVEMQFNNKQFEAGIQESLHSIDNLKQGLNGMDGASRGLDEAGSAAERLGIDFSALQVVAITAIAKITDAAIDFGINMAKSLTVDQITAGFDKYEQKVGAVQTIMSATGLTMDEVSESLRRLNFFTDETSYNFTDMVDNVGKFTGAGVELDTAVTAMQGIANWAALSGQNAEGASRAMYNLSQALGVGAVKLQDWKSIENVNMATIEFKDAVIESALELGTLVEYQGKYYTSLEKAKQGNEDAEVSATNFNQALKDGWFNSEVLIDVLGRYGQFADDVFQATETQGILASEAIEMLSEETQSLGERAFRAAQEAKTFTDALGSVKDAVSTGWMSSFELVIGDYEEAKVLWTDVANALWDVFASGGEARNEMLGIWKDMEGRDVLIEALSNAFTALFAVIEPIKQAFQDIFPSMTAERLYELTESFRDFTASLIINEATADNIQRTFAGLFAVLDIVRIAITSVFKVAGQLLGVILPVGDGVLGVTGGLGDLAVALRNAIVDSDIFGQGVAAIGTILSGLRNIITGAADGIRDGIGRLREYFSQFSGIDIGPLQIFSGDVEAAFSPFTFIANVFKKAWDVIISVFEWMAPIVAPIAQKVGQALTKFGSSVSNALRSGDLKNLLSVVNTGLLGGLIVGIRKFVDSLTDITSNAGGFLEGVTGILDGVRGSLEAYQSSLKSKTLLNIALAVGVLAAALLVLSTIDGPSMAASLAGITVLFVDLAAIMLVLSKNMGTIKLGGVAIQMIAISTAVLILASAMKKVAELKWDEVLKGTLAVGALSAILVKTAEVLSKNTQKMMSGSIGLIAMAAAVLVLAQAVKQLAVLDLGGLVQGLIGVGVLMAEMAGFTQIVNPTKMLSTGIAMIALGAALTIVSSAVAQLASLGIGELAVGLIGIAGALAILAGFTQIVNPAQMISTGLAMIALGAALLMIADVVSTLGALSIGELAKGLIAVAVALAALAAFTNLVNPVQMLATGVSMIALGAALMIIGNVVQNLGSMSWGEVAKGLVALAGALLIIVVAANAMTGAILGAAAMLVIAPAILILAAALKVMGSMSLAEIGKAMLALAGVFVVIGLAALVLTPVVPIILLLAGAIVLLGAAVLAIGAGLLAFSAGMAALAVSGTAGAAALAIVIMTIIELIPAASIALAEGVISFIKVIGDGIPIIMEATANLVEGIVQVLTEMIPAVVEATGVFINAMLDSFLEHIPKAVDTGMKLMIGFLDGIASNIEEVTALSLKVISEWMAGIAEGIPGMAKSGADIMIAFMDAIGAEVPRLVDAGFKMITDFVNGTAEAIRDNTDPLIEAFENLASAMIDGLTKGLYAHGERAIKSVKDLGNGIINGFKNVLGIASPSKVFEDMGEDTVDGYTKGVDDKSDDAEDAAKRMADKAINSAYKEFGVKNGTSSIFKELGVSSAESFIDGLTVMGDSIKASITKAFAVDEKALKLSFGTDTEGYEAALAENKAYVKGLTDIVDEAIQTIEQRLDSYTDMATDRMSRINTESEITVAEMITNLKHNQMAIAEWADGIAELAERGLNDGLLEELRAAGPKSAGEVKALVAASDKEIQELNVVMSRGGKVATEALATTVGQGAPLMIEPGQSLVDAVAQGLTSTSSVNDAMAMLIDHTKRTATERMAGEEFTEIGRNIPDKLSAGISSNTEGVSAAVTGMADVAKTSTEAAFDINSPSGVYEEYGGNLMEGMSLGIDNNADRPVDSLSNMFGNMETEATDSGAKVAEAAEQGLQMNQGSFGELGTQYGQDFATNLANTQIQASNSGRDVAKRAEEGLKHNKEIFGQTGSKYGQDFNTELTNKQVSANISGRDIALAAERGIKSNTEEFRKAGVQCGQGFIEGLRSQIQAAAEAAAEMAREASRAANRNLRIKSPSRVFFEIGQHTGEGFVEGMRAMAGAVSNASSEMSDSAIRDVADAIDRVASMVDGSMDSSPVITPVLDLSKIQNGTKALSEMLSGTQEVTPIARNVTKISSAMAARERAQTSPSNPGSREASGETKYEFVQNNYSPKALSRLEIYRQTKNLLGQQKGLVEGV